MAGAGLPGCIASIASVLAAAQYAAGFGSGAASGGGSQWSRRGRCAPKGCGAMNLYLLRHGVAVEPGAPGYARDADRPLTPKGRRKLKEIAKGLQALDICFDLILASPYVRARQTAELVAQALGLRRRLQFSDALVPGSSLKRLVELIHHLEPVPGELLLVGHEPFLSDLISLLLSGQTGLAITMKKAGLCKLALDALEAGRCATLEWLLAPKQLRLIRAKQLI
jgi:phosphohistidine phosphatase